MRGDKRDRDFSAGQAHCEILRSATIGKKLSLAGELKARLVHSGLVNRPRYDGIEFAAARERDRFFKCGRSGAAGFDRWFAQRTIGIFPDDDVLGSDR